MFGQIAPRYDLANKVLSFNLHKSWNQKLVDEVSCNNPSSLLDLCAGTGEIAYLWLKRSAGNKAAILLDFCPEMLEVAKKRKPDNHSISFLQADAQAIPLPENSVEAITIAYGIRNVENPSRCFQEAFRVLKPGGTFAILELTEPKNRLLRLGHNLYLRFLLPTLGGLLTRQPEAYRYLSTTIKTFTKPALLADTLLRAGFSSVRTTPLSGGIAHLICGKKP